MSRREKTQKFQKLWQVSRPTEKRRSSKLKNFNSKPKSCVLKTYSHLHKKRRIATSIVEKIDETIKRIDPHQIRMIVLQLRVMMTTHNQARRMTRMLESRSALKTNSTALSCLDLKLKSGATRLFSRKLRLAVLFVLELV